MPIESVIPSNNFVLCHPLLLLPSIFRSIRVFSNESALPIRWPKYWSFSFSISPSNKYSGLISLGWTGWISLPFKGRSRVFYNTTVQKHQFSGTKLSLWFNTHLQTWPWKNIVSTRWTIVGKVMSLLFNMLSRLVIAFFSKKQASFNFVAVVTICSDFGAPEIKSVTVSIVSPSICYEVMGPDALILVFWMLSFKPAFSLSSFTFIKRLFSSSCFVL